MMEQAKPENSCEEKRSPPWNPLRKWWQPGWFFSQDVGLPPSLERGDPHWMDADPFQRSFCLGYLYGSMHHPSLKVNTWGVSMDVAHFSPSEISLGVRDGFLEVRGKHEEKPDQHGFISRCFTRKYRLPAEVGAATIVARLSVDGVLTVEAPVPETAVPATFFIPIQVENEDAAEQEVEEKDQVEEESGVDQAKPGCSSAEVQHEEESVPADDEGAKDLQKSSEPQEMMESQEIQKASNQQQEEADMDATAQEKVDEAKQLEEQLEERKPPSEEQNRVLEDAHIEE
uniref:SHSP domain-containing protein n=1 Tax=Oryzias latipes TaxID=8090 RepID=A0A3P9IDY3_ORYLA